MRPLVSVLAAGMLCTLGQSQEPSPTPVEIADEPHHTLLLENPEARVFRLRLQPNEVTLPHRHKAFYVYLSLHAVQISNEVRGRQPVGTNIEAGEVHTSKGGFTVAERDKSSEPADILVVEAAKTSAGEFNTPMGGFRYHDAAFGTIFEAPAIRGYTMTIAAGGRTEEHTENYDRLLIAVSDLKLRENVQGQPQSELRMKAGDIQWIPNGMTHSTTNIGTSPATFITLEFA